MESGGTIEGPIGVVGLGYVGLPLAVAVARQRPTIGIDIDAGRIAELRKGIDRTGEVDPEALAAAHLTLSNDMTDAKQCTTIIVTVPTPVDSTNQPDLGPILSATRAIAAILRPGAGTLIVYESTVYPGVTEEVCGPELERVSGLQRGVDFFLGYSPERINPGDRNHRIDTIVKVVAGENDAITDRLCDLYGAVTTAGVFRASSIKAAEAAKVIENAQRDINIAFINEVTQIFNRMDISIWDVLDAASTKWNFLPFQPGLVGGHCIGVDPFYLSHCAQQLGCDPRVVLAGRSINDHMGKWIADRIHEEIAANAKVLVLGLTFKENVPDARNSRVVDLVQRLEWLRHEVKVHDPLLSVDGARGLVGSCYDGDALGDTYDAVILAVPHRQYLDRGSEFFASLLRADGLLADVKGACRSLSFPSQIRRWSL